MIEIIASPDADAVAIAAAVVEERDKILCRVARIARRVSAGDLYERSAFLTTRELFGPLAVNLHTWQAVYGGSGQYDFPTYQVASHSEIFNRDGRPGPAPFPVVDEATLNAERDRAAGVSRETSTPAAPYDVRNTPRDSRGGSQRDCGCASCLTFRERYDRNNGLVPVAPVAPQVTPDVEPRRCECDDCSDSLCVGSDDDDHEACDDHGCVECHGEGYSCDDHDCDHCFSGHSVDSCCGWCAECGTHQGSGEEDKCPNCSYCRGCGHNCDNY